MALKPPDPKCNITAVGIPPPPTLSPVFPLLTNNDPPESHEEQLARQIIASSTIALRQSESILAPGNQILNSLLKTRRDEYQEQIRLHQSVLAKSRQIPSDILSEIFSHVVADHGESLSWCEGVWTVTQVCRRWQAAALSSPRLWSVLPVLGPQYRKGHRNLCRLQGSLQRSGCLSLRLVITHFGFDLPDEHPFLNIILPHLHRVAYLTLDHPCKPFPLLANVYAFPSLKSIAFTDIHRSTLESQHITQTAPLLEELQISPVARSWTFTDIQRIYVPWSQLRRVSVNEIDSNAAKSLLQAATSLEECTLSLVWCEYGSTAPPSFSSKCLGRLCIEVTAVDVVDKFFEHAKFPSLTKLSIDSQAVGVGCLSEFILRSSCTLTLLGCGIPLSAVKQDILRIFSLVPEVTDLRLCVGDGFRIDSLLKIDPPHPPLLPKLRHLYITTDNLTSLVEDVDPSTFRNITSPPVLSRTVAAIDTLILRERFLHESGRDKIFCLLDRWTKTNIDHDRVLWWSTQLRQMSTTHSEGIPRTADFAAELAMIVSEIEAHGGIYPQILNVAGIIDNLHHLLHQLGDNADLEPLRQRLSAIRGEWVASIHAYLNSVGWMKCGPSALVYAKRTGSIVAKVAGYRIVNRFASIGLVDGGVFL